MFGAALYGINYYGLVKLHALYIMDLLLMGTCF